MKKFISALTALIMMSGATAIVSSAETEVMPAVCTAAVFNSLAAKPAVPVVKSSYSCTTTAVRIKWNKVSGASGYRVYRYNAALKKWKKIATVKYGNTLEYRDRGLTPGTKYKYNGYSYSSKGSYYYGKYHKVYTLWFLDGEVGEEHNGEPAYGDKTQFG